MIALKIRDRRPFIWNMHSVEFIFGGRWTLARNGARMSRPEATALVAALGSAGFVARVAR